MHNGIFGAVCPFHTIDKIENYHILKCEYKLFGNDWCHVIHFKDPISDDGTLRNTNGLSIHYNQSNLINIIEEKISFLPITTLYNITSDNNNDMLNHIVNFLLHYVYSYSNKGFVNKLLISSDPSAFSNFLQTVGVNIDPTSRDITFIQNFRFLTMINCKNKLITKQVFSLINLIKYFLFTTRRSSRSHITPLYNCKNCKLKKLNERFLYYDYATFHSIYCQPKDDNARWEILRKITPEHLRSLLDELCGRLASTTSAKRII